MDTHDLDILRTTFNFMGSKLIACNTAIDATCNDAPKRIEI